MYVRILGAPELRQVVGSSVAAISYLVLGVFWFAVSRDIQETKKNPLLDKDTVDTAALKV